MKKTKASQTLENTQFENGCKIKIITVFKNQFVKHLNDVSIISHEDDGVKYLLIVIDIFSKYLWIQPLKNKRF